MGCALLAYTVERTYSPAAPTTRPRYIANRSCKCAQKEGLFWRGEKVIKHSADGVAEFVEANRQQRCHQGHLHHLLWPQSNQAQRCGWRGFAQVRREDGFASGRRGFLLDLHQLGHLHVDGAGGGSRASLFFGNWRSGFWARWAFAQFWFRSRRQDGSNRVRVHWRSV